MDSGPAHTTDFTSKWMKDRKVKWIPKEHWFLNSTDIAVNGILKRFLKKRQAYSVGELVCGGRTE